jgi:hypothetical protein
MRSLVQAYHELTCCSHNDPIGESNGQLPSAYEEPLRIVLMTDIIRLFRKDDYAGETEHLTPLIRYS